MALQKWLQRTAVDEGTKPGQARMVTSMGRVSPSDDSAAMESFFALLKKNILGRRSWVARVQLRIAIVTWIKRTYHRHRHQPRRGRLAPIEFETNLNTTAAMST